MNHNEETIEASSLQKLLWLNFSILYNESLPHDKQINEAENIGVTVFELQKIYKVSVL